MPRCGVLLVGMLALTPLGSAGAQTGDAERLVGAMLSGTPVVQDLQDLTDRIGGRPTGSPANQRAVEWALERFRSAGIEARREPFRVVRPPFVPSHVR